MFSRGSNGCIHVKDYLNWPNKTKKENQGPHLNQAETLSHNLVHNYFLC